MQSDGLTRGESEILTTTTSIVRRRHRAFRLASVLFALVIPSAELGCSASADETKGEHASAESVSAQATISPVTARVGDKVSFAVTVRGTTNRVVDIQVGIRDPSGAVIYSTDLVSQTLSSGLSVALNDELSIQSTDGSGVYTLWIIVRESESGESLLDRPNLARFTIANQAGEACLVGGSTCTSAQCASGACGGTSSHCGGNPNCAGSTFNGAAASAAAGGHVMSGTGDSGAAGGSSGVSTVSGIGSNLNRGGSGSGGAGGSKLAVNGGSSIGHGGVDSGGSAAQNTGGSGSGATGSSTGLSGVTLGFSCVGVASGELAKQLRSGKIDMAGTWNDTADGQIEQWSISDEYKGWNKMIDVAVGGIYRQNGDSWAEAARGAYLDRWQKIIDNLASGWGSRDPSMLNIRFAHEFNLRESQWRVTGDDVENFKKAWIAFHELLKRKAPNSSLVWCPNDGTSGDLNLHIGDAYPGNDYVDVIAIDTYNSWPWVDTEDTFSQKLGKGSVSEPEGAEKWRLFAQQRGKPLAIGEWASNGDTGTSIDAGGGGDSPTYIRLFHDWLVEHGGNGAGQIKYAVYFNCPGYGAEAGGEKYQIWPTTIQPKARDEIFRLF